MAYFRLLTPRESIIFGKKLTTSSSGIEPGILVALDTETAGDAVAGETVSTSGSTSTVFGFAFGARTLEYTPTTKVYDIGEAVSVVQGTGVAAMSSDFFTSGSGDWATPDAVLYAANGGKLSTAGSVKVGRLIRTKDRTIVGGGETIALIRFNIQP